MPIYWYDLSKTGSDLLSVLNIFVRAWFILSHCLFPCKLYSAILSFLMLESLEKTLN